MAEESVDFGALMRGVRKGSEDAVWQLVEQYGDSLRRAVRRSLNRRLRSKFDSLDFVQLVWSSFFREPADLRQFNRPEELAAFLAVMARNKVGMEIRRRLMTEKYNLNRERSLEEPGVRERAEGVNPQPMPLQVAEARERLERMLTEQPQHYQRIVRLRLQGRTNAEIAETLHLHESTVRRFLKKLLKDTAE